MAQRVEHSPMEAVMAALLSQCLDDAGEALRILVDEASKIERSLHLNARPYERSDGLRDAYARRRPSRRYIYITLLTAPDCRFSQSMIAFLTTCGALSHTGG